MAWRPLLLNIVRNGVFSEAGLQIPIKIAGIDKFKNTVHCNALQFSAIFYCLYHSQFPAAYRVLSSEAQVPVLDQAVYSELSIPATPPDSQLRQGWSYSILSWETKGGKSLEPLPCIKGPQEGQSPLLDTCIKHYSPQITCTRSGPSKS